MTAEGVEMQGTIRSGETRLFPRFLDLAYPNIESGEGVWLSTTDGQRILDACSGGAMVTCLGYDVPEVVAAAADQAERISYYYSHHFTNEPQERLAERLLEVAAPEMARVRFVSEGSEANETALQLARLYHVERGETDLCPQAFVAGRSLGLQFHPEVTPEIMDDWVRVYRHELDADGVDPDALLEETHRRGTESRRMSWQLLERYLSDVAGLSTEATPDGAANRRVAG